MELVVRSKGAVAQGFPATVVFSSRNDCMAAAQVGDECPADTPEVCACARPPTISALVYTGYITVYFCHYGLAKKSGYNCKLLRLDEL